MGVILKIPVELLEMYNSDPEVFIRDVANFPQETVSRYFKIPGAIYKAIQRSRKNPFDFITHKFDDNFRASDFKHRFLHFDLSLGGDLCTFAMGHASSFIEVNRLIEGNLVADKLPFVYIDFVGIMYVEKKEEVWLPRIPELVEELTSRHFNIQLLTFDRFQSAYIIQLLKDRGYLADVLSIDRTTTKIIVDISRDDRIRRESTKGNYLAGIASLKDAMNQFRISIPYHPAVRTRTAESQFELEAKSAQHFVEKMKVDHGSGGSIDVVQAIAGTCFNIECNCRDFQIADDIKEVGDTFYETTKPGYVALDQSDFEKGGGRRHESYLG